jgi:hypothetical protein
MIPHYTAITAFMSRINRTDTKNDIVCMHDLLIVSVCMCIY